MSRNSIESVLVMEELLTLLKLNFGETSTATSTNRTRMTIEAPKYLFNCFFIYTKLLIKNIISHIRQTSVTYELFLLMALILILFR